MPYGYAPYEEAAAKGQARMSTLQRLGQIFAGAGAGLAATPTNAGGLESLFTGFAGGYGQANAARQAAEQYAMRKIEADRAQRSRDIEDAYHQAQIEALGREKPVQVDPLLEEKRALLKAQAAAAQSRATKPPGTPEDTSWIDSYVTTTASGQQFLDVSQLQGKDHAAAVRRAAALGIPALGSVELGQLQDIAAATANVDGVLDSLQGLLPRDAQGRVAAIPGIRLSQLLQTNAQRAAFNTWRGSAIRTLRASAGSKGLRLNQKEIDLAVKNEIPQITDTWDVANEKMNNVRQMLHNAENPILRKNWGRIAPGPGQATKADEDYVHSLGIK